MTTTARDHLFTLIASIPGSGTADWCDKARTLLNAVETEALPAWEAMYEPGNVSDYLIGYTNTEAAAKGAAEAWLRSQKEEVGRLEWAPQTPLDGYDTELELIELHDDGIDTGPGITVRRRTTAPVV